MIEIDIPGFRLLKLNHLVLDYNGTLALDSLLLPEVVCDSPRICLKSVCGRDA